VTKQVNRRGRAQGSVYLGAGQIRQVLGNTFFHSQCRFFHCWSFLEWSSVWWTATRPQPCRDVSLIGDVCKHPTHLCFLQHNLAPVMWTAPTKLISSLLPQKDGEARMVALFLGSAKHRKCVSTSSTSYGRSAPADLATCLASRCRARQSCRAHTFTASKQMHTRWCLQSLFNSPCQGSPRRAEPLSELWRIRKKNTVLSARSLQECRECEQNTGLYRHALPVSCTSEALKAGLPPELLI